MTSHDIGPAVQFLMTQGCWRDIQANAHQLACCLELGAGTVLLHQQKLHGLLQLGKGGPCGGVCAGAGQHDAQIQSGHVCRAGGQPAVCDHVMHDLILVQMCEWLRPVVELPHGGPEGVHICSLAHRLLGLEDFRSHVPQCPAQAQLLQHLSCLSISLPGQAEVCQLGLARPCSGMAVHTAVQQDVIRL